MFVLGITGGIGTGKSTVAMILRAWGLPVIDADAIAHELTSRAGETTAKIAFQLGDAFLDGKGALDRRKVAAIAFSQKKILDQLSAIIHQDVVRVMDERLEQARRKKIKALVLDVPIPVERGFLDVCDQVWAVTARRDIRLERLGLRGMSQEEAIRRMSVQMTPEEYADLAAHVIENNGSLLDLENQVRSLLELELGRRGIPVPGLNAL